MYNWDENTRFNPLKSPLFTYIPNSNNIEQKIPNIIEEPILHNLLARIYVENNINVLTYIIPSIGELKLIDSISYSFLYDLTYLVIIDTMIFLRSSVSYLGL